MVMSENDTKTTITQGTTREVVDNNVVNSKKRTKKLPKSVRPEEFVELIKAVPAEDKIARIAFLLAYASGMRISEVLRFNKEHIRGNKIFVPESKYGVERVVPLPKGWRKEFEALTPLNKTARTLERKFKMYSKKAGLNPAYTFHGLRHGFATRLVESGVPINQVQLLLGHSNVATTSIYTRANPIDAIKSYEELF